MTDPVARTVVSFPAAEDAAAKLFSVLLATLGDAVPAAFLDSSDNASSPAPQRSRYSVLAFSRGAAAQVVRLDSGAFDWLAEHWRHRGKDGSDEASGTDTPCAPFQLGWVGWIGYEYQAQLFAATHAVVIDHRGSTAEIQSAGPDPGWVSMVADAMVARPKGQGGPARLLNLSVRDSHEDYLAKIRAAQTQIHAGNSYEVCLTTAVTGEFTGDPWSAYWQLRQRNRAPFTQFLRFPPGEHDAVTAVLSTSPERFAVITAEGIIRSEPIKGTRPRGASRQLDAEQLADLRTHPKDRAENVMIADLVRNDLSIHAVPGTLCTERLCEVETYPSVHQMVSTISAQLEPQALRAHALRDAFPPGSMTGAPKISTMEILADLEELPRGAYSGVAGWFSSTGACDLSVLIRTAVLTQRARGSWSCHIGIGGAITADSEPEAEWQEIITKSQGPLRALGADFPHAETLPC